MNTLLAVAIVWILSGLMTTYLMARAGHRNPVWLLIGLVLGPLGFPILYERAERRTRLVASHEQRISPDGGLRVLVALDGSPESEAAFQGAFRVLGQRDHTVFLAAVIDYDAGDDADQTAAAEARLAECAQRCPVAAVSYHVVAGRPAPALIEFAEEHDVDVIVAGRRGRGMSTVLLGSVSSALLRAAKVPVLIGGYELHEPVSRPSAGEELESRGDEGVRAG